MDGEKRPIVPDHHESDQHDRPSKRQKTEVTESSEAGVGGEEQENREEQDDKEENERENEEITSSDDGESETDDDDDTAQQEPQQQPHPEPVTPTVVVPHQHHETQIVAGLPTPVLVPQGGHPHEAQIVMGLATPAPEAEMHLLIVPDDGFALPPPVLAVMPEPVAPAVVVPHQQHETQIVAGLPTPVLVPQHPHEAQIVMGLATPAPEGELQLGLNLPAAVPDDGFALPPPVIAVMG
ncbi:hypothetical protein NEUTE1DRAFT_111459 [Neurospora tetrasperma FGSC 2508]|uniref:Uncharacterized protein n=1 Tax=Neurospora tetrasperma (strain FGSC 2508 / ATCC MYA-4615 / P0657) TaxID=510951 RepID=F8MP90_NEUT8|nr:uncharacterized protein NEUTE1DRAFT_111459 [Neurospora tetrasperma FGSC 2508]EGO57102.1 hypothetical protein NEUTE1DRAFT_111459 [Neurospora tetrasperma FGSC 2508]EGZ69981.1 hypothetical protein NEUTE2DRAFT_67944 [Neurospora tetrasperma FGSC 2509]